jgi:hypothetical protein
LQSRRRAYHFRVHLDGVRRVRHLVAHLPCKIAGCLKANIASCTCWRSVTLCSKRPTFAQSGVVFTFLVNDTVCRVRVHRVDMNFHQTPRCLGKIYCRACMQAFGPGLEDLRTSEYVSTASHTYAVNSANWTASTILCAEAAHALRLSRHFPTARNQSRNSIEATLSTHHGVTLTSSVPIIHPPR